MAKSHEVLQMLIPSGGWVTTSENYEDIKFMNCKPITKTEYELGFAKYDAWKAEQDAAKAAQRQAILDRLGLTAEEARLLLG